MSYETLIFERLSEHVALARLARPDALNALNTEMMQELRDFFAGLYIEQLGLRALILTGSGERAFCAGADLKERNGMSDADWTRQHATLEQMIRALSACPVPVIAAVNGVALGGGMEIALACDFIYASTGARFGFPEGKIGIIPGAMGTQTLTRAVGQRRAKEIALTGRFISADEGAEWGLVNRVCAEGQLLAEARETAELIAANAPLSMRQVKKTVDAAASTDLASGYAFELEAYYRTIPTEDRREGVRAFNEKRAPKFEDR